MLQYPQQKTAPAQDKNHLTTTFVKAVRSMCVHRNSSAQTFRLFSNKLNETDFIHICYQSVQVNVVVRERNRDFFIQGRLKEAF